VSSSTLTVPYSTLRDRVLAREGLFVTEGAYLVERMLGSGCRPHSVLCVPAVASRYESLCGGRCPVVVRDADELSRIIGFQFHRGVLGCGYRPAPTPLDELARGSSLSEARILVLCPDLNDEANLGSIARSAVAFGAAGLLLGPRSCDPYSRRALRLSMGASLFLGIASIGGAAQAAGALHAGGYAIYGAANCPQARALEELDAPRRLVIAFGNEGTGLGEAWTECCDALVKIPMGSELDSLNVGVAAGIVLYALRRAPRKQGELSPGGAA
jgi:tRNA G18 (ribose-2'-O)-methylase SpoU